MNRDQLREHLIKTIRDAVPDDEDCEQYPQWEDCPHPVHLGASVDGTVLSVYADVEGLVDLILEAMEE